jgi:uncharacterized protein (DUF4415 family)
MIDEKAFVLDEYEEGIENMNLTPLSSEEKTNLYKRMEGQKSASVPRPVTTIMLHLDTDVFRWYIDQGDDYEARINSTLRRAIA